MQPEIPFGLALVQIRLGQKHLILCPGNIPQYRAGLKGLVVHIQLLQALLDDPEGVVGIINGEGGGKSQFLNVPPENPHTGGMKGRRPDVPGIRANLFLQPLFQLTSGFVGKGDGDHLPRGGGFQGAQEVGPAGLPFIGGRFLHILRQKADICLCDMVGHLLGICASAIAQQVRNAVDEHRGLSAARPSKQKQGALRGQHPLQLTGVQITKRLGNDPASQCSKL